MRTMLCAIALHLLISNNTAIATPITITASGPVDFVDPALSGTFSVGQTFGMTYTFASTTSARAGSDSTFAVFDALTANGFSIGPYSGSATGAQEIQVDNNPPSPDDDRYAVITGAGSTVSGPPVAGLSLSSFFFRLDDSSDSVFTDALILPTSLTLSSFTSTLFVVSFVDDAQNVFTVSGTITSLVPEPSSVALLGFGVVGLLSYALRARNRIL